MDKWFDEITGLWNIGPKPEPKPEYFVISKKPGPGGAPIGYAFSATRAEAMRIQLLLGIRATTKIVRI